MDICVRSDISLEINNVGNGLNVKIPASHTSAIISLGSGTVAYSACKKYYFVYLFLGVLMFPLLCSVVLLYACSSFLCPLWCFKSFFSGIYFRRLNSLLLYFLIIVQGCYSILAHMLFVTFDISI